MYKFNVFLLLDETARIPLEICSEDTISQVKQKIENLICIEAYKQVLFLGSKVLVNNLKVADYKIAPDDKVKLVRKVEGSIQVFIKNVVSNGTKKSTPIIINPFSTILELKKLYYERTLFPVNQQRLIFEGKVLDNDKRLPDYKIEHESNIQLVVRLPGGFDC